MARKPTVLLIDDELLTIMRWFPVRMRKHGFNVISCESFGKAVDLLLAINDETQKRIDAVILDIMFPLSAASQEAFKRLTSHTPNGLTDAMGAGMTLLPLIREKLPSKPVAVLTSVPEETSGVEGSLAGNVELFQRKPADESFFSELKELIEKAQEAST